MIYDMQGLKFQFLRAVEGVAGCSLMMLQATRNTIVILNIHVLILTAQAFLESELAEKIVMLIQTKEAMLDYGLAALLHLNFGRRINFMSVPV